MEQNQEKQQVTVAEFWEMSLDVAKKENVSQEEIILFNVTHLEGAIRNSRTIIAELRTALEAFEAQIRPTKLRLRSIASQTSTPSVRKEYSKLAKKLYHLRNMYSTGQQDVSALRKSLKKDRGNLNIVLEALREYYKQNPCEANSVKG